MKLRMKFYNNGDRVVKKGNNPVPYDLLLYVMQLDRVNELKMINDKYKTTNEWKVIYDWISVFYWDMLILYFTNNIYEAKPYD